MTSRMLQALGVAFVLALVGGAVAGFAVLKDRVRVVVAADEPATGPDPTALLRDDVQTLARDVAALQQALASNFEQLGNALEERANARHADVLALQKELAAVQKSLVAVRQETSALPPQLQALPAQVAAAVVAATPGASPASPVVVTPTAAPAASEPVAVPSTPEPAPVASPASAPPPPKAGFLSFSVPTAQFHFGEPQDYTVVAELSRVGFDAKSTLHDFSGVTSQVRGAFRADFDDPQGAWTGDVSVQAATLCTGVDGRDENMREHLDSKQFPDIRFVIAGFQPAADGLDVAKQTVRGDVRGTMTIRGKSLPFTMPIAVAVDPQKRVVLTGQAPLKLSDYGVPVPSQLGLINMQDEVVVWIALRARMTTGGRK